MHSCKSKIIKSRNSFTLLELITAITISLLVLSGLGAIFAGTLKVWAKVQDSTSASKEGKLAVYWITKDIRARTVLSAGGNILKLSGNIEYKVINKELLRNADLLAQGVDSLSFLYFNKDGSAESDTGKINFIEINLTINKGGHTLTLKDGARIRNYNERKYMY